MRSGHIPGSVSLPYTDLLNAGRHLPPAGRSARPLRSGRRRRHAAGGHQLRVRRHRLHPDPGPAPGRPAARARCMTGPGPNGADAPTRRSRLADHDDDQKRGFRTTLSHVGRNTKQRARVRQSAAAARLDRAGPDGRRTPGAAGPARRAGADLRHRRVGHPLGAGGRDRRDRGRHALLYRLHRPGRGDDPAAGLAEGRRPLADAGPRLRPGAQLRQHDAERLRRRDDVLSCRRSTRPASPR